MRHMKRSQLLQQRLLKHNLGESTRLQSSRSSCAWKHLVANQESQRSYHDIGLYQQRFQSSNAASGNYQRYSLPLHGQKFERDNLMAMSTSIPLTRNLSTVNTDDTSSLDYASVSTVLELQVQEGKLKEGKAEKQPAKRLTRLQKSSVGDDNATLFKMEEQKDEDNQHEKAEVDGKGKNEKDSLDSFTLYSLYTL